MSLPLAGKRIVVTRALHQAGKLRAALLELGAEVLELPLIEMVPPPSYAPLDRALQNSHLYQWLVLTSANAVRVLAERLQAAGLTPSSLSGIRVIAVGPATAAALKSLPLHVDLVPESYVAESLVDALQAERLKAGAAGGRVLLVRARLARDLIPDALRAQGAIVDVVDAYETVLPAGSLTVLPHILVPAPDAVTFTSSSTVRNFVALLEQARLERPRSTRAISIGPITSRALREASWEPSAEATQFDVEGLVAATVRALSM